MGLILLTFQVLPRPAQSPRSDAQSHKNQMKHTCNPSTGEVEAEGSEVQDYLKVITQSGFKGRLSNMMNCFKNDSNSLLTVSVGTHCVIPGSRSYFSCWRTAELTRFYFRELIF